MNRDKEATKQKLLEAVGEIVRRDGFASLGINAIAKEAKTDKVLIYRYFNGIDGLLEEYVRSKDFYLNAKPLYEKYLTKKKPDIVALAEELFIGQLQAVLKDPEWMEFLIWELGNKNELTTRVAMQREALAVEVLGKLSAKKAKGHVDIPALVSLLLSGIYYLALRSRHVRVFNGIPLDTPDGWKRIEDSIRFIINSAVG